mmetsp:Transcript_75239/g.133231  ORF Transcript_75239/g.133231 Transcript_75239/m.133231 type:complete len:205 (-) Transcript_75239:107-721(-)
MLSPLQLSWSPAGLTGHGLPCRGCCVRRPRPCRGRCVRRLRLRGPHLLSSLWQSLSPLRPSSGHRSPRFQPTDPPVRPNDSVRERALSQVLSLAQRPQTASCRRCVLPQSERQAHQRRFGGLPRGSRRSWCEAARPPSAHLNLRAEPANCLPESRRPWPALRPKLPSLLSPLPCQRSLCRSRHGSAPLLRLPRPLISPCAPQSI